MGVWKGYFKEGRVGCGGMEVVERRGGGVGVWNKNGGGSVCDLEGDFEEIKSVEEKICEGGV